MPSAAPIDDKIPEEDFAALLGITVRSLKGRPKASHPLRQGRPPPSEGPLDRPPVRMQAPAPG